ncbi:MAG: hypothetical protein AAGJ35_08970, partial [Myxococcota bacterium]
MTFEIKEKELQLSLKTLHVEGLEQGLAEDLMYRPNKYFHPVEEVRIQESSTLCIRYKKQVYPIEGEVPLLQVMHVLQGVIQAQEHISTDQAFYLFPGVEAFCLDRRKNLKVCLINVRPHKHVECHPQELSVDAFVQLLARHSPKAHRKVVQYNKPILTLKQLKSVLEPRSASVLATTTMTLSVLSILAFMLLRQFGPPRIQYALRQWTTELLNAGKRFTRSGTTEWFEQVRKERIAREYRYPPLSLTLVLQPQAKTDQERQSLFQALNRVLAQEFPKPNSYQLLIPSPSLSQTAHDTWKRLCQHALKKAPCDATNWLLQIKRYKGGLRPLLHALLERTRQQDPKAPLLQIQHVQFVGAAKLMLRPPLRSSTSTPSTQTPLSQGG